jgi:DNA-directed RNA polymerase
MSTGTTTIQRELEQEMLERGQERYNKRNISIQGSQQEVAHRSITEVLPKVSECLTNYVDQEENRLKTAGGTPAAWHGIISKLDVNILAYLGLNAMYDAVVRHETLTQAMLKIGSKINQEVWAQGLKEYDKDLYKRVVRQVTKDHSSERYRVKALRIISNKEGYYGDTFDKPLRLAVAAPVLNAVLEVSNMFDIYESFKNTKTIRYLGLTKTAEDLINDRVLDEAWASPMYAPMVVPPSAWTSFDTGVYLDPMVSANVKLVRRHSNTQAREIKHQFTKGIPAYVEALNAVQATPLKINLGILKAVEWCIDTNQVFAKFPELKPPAIPEMPEDEEVTEEYKRQIRSDRKAWHIKRRECVANLAVIDSDLRTAKEMSKFEQFWIGWSFDFRGRMYPVSHFNYHRDDHVKALFLLARGKKLDDESVGWLYIHLANTGDFEKVSKKSLDDRIQWVEDNHDQIMAAAQDYKYTFDYWSKADKPYQFLSACFEYKKLQEQGIDNYVCHLPISLDATNSGVQIYSAALRSYEDGKMTNLVPLKECQDVYKEVADEVNKRLLKDGSEDAQRWLEFGVNRSICKRNCMTFAYSSQERGFGDQLIEDLMQPLQKSVSYGQIPEHPFGDKREQERMARFLAKINYQAVQSVITSASRGMDYLRSYAHKVAKENKPIRWTSPSGFPVVQKYTKFIGKRVQIFLYDREAKIRKRTRFNLIEEDEFAYDTKKSANAVAPNFIHALDSALMHETILLGKANGIEDFFLIHDSYASTAADTWKLYHCVRKAFVSMFKDQCVFENFEAEVRQQLDNPNEDLPKIPPKGDLDVEGILDSEYCFS